MLIIKPIQDKEYQAEVCHKCGFEYSPLSFAYSAKEDDKLIAGCQFDILGEACEISGFEMVEGFDEDLEALIILGRAVLNFMELSGAKYCTFGASEKRYARAIGFRETDGVWKITLEGLFDGKCNKCE